MPRLRRFFALYRRPLAVSSSPAAPEQPMKTLAAHAGRRDSGSGMDVVNPLTGNLAQSTSVVQRQQSALKSEQVRREQAVRKDAGASGDRFEHQVESAEETTPVHDEPDDARRGKSRRQPQSPSDDDEAPPPHVDLVA